MVTNKCRSYEIIMINAHKQTNIIINSYETKKFMPSQKMRKTLKEKKINLEKLAF